MSTHPPLSPSLLPTTLASVSPVHLPAPRPMRFASYQGPLPVAFQVHTTVPPPAHQHLRRPGLSARAHSFSADNLRTAFASLNFVEHPSVPSDAPAPPPSLTPAPSSPPDYLLELLSILQPRPSHPAHSHSTASSSLHTLSESDASTRSITPPPRPAAPFAPFRHRRHPSATSLLLEDASDPDALASKGRKGTEVPYWVPSPQARETTRKKRSGASLRRSASAATQSSSGGSSPPQLSFTSGFVLSTPGGSTPISPLPITPAFPTPVSIPADARVLGLHNLSGYPFPVTPAREECAAPFAPTEVAEAPVEHAQKEGEAEEDGDMEVGMSPRAFLFEELRAQADEIGAGTSALQEVEGPVEVAKS